MKLRNKLILSCAALAAVATTAVSSTFAWYTSNTEVTVNTLSANTKNSGSDLLMIADGLTTTTNPGDTEIALNALNWDTKITNIVTTQTEMTPLAYNGKVKGATYSTNAETTDTAGSLRFLTAKYTALAGTATYDANTSYYKAGTTAGTYELDDTVTSANFADKKASLFTASMGTDTSTAADDSGYLKFVLYLKNGATSAKNVKMTITGLANADQTALPSKSIITPAVNRANINSTFTNQTSYTTNALRVVAMDLEIASVVEGAFAGGTRTVADETVYSMKSALANDFNFGDSTGSAPNAHAYYNSVMNPDLDTTDTYNQDTANFVSLGGSNGTTLNVQVPAAADKDDFIQLTFKIFLNGWDTACFDACQNQHLSFGIKFEIPQA